MNRLLFRATLQATVSVILFKRVFVSPIDDQVEWMTFFEQRYRHGAIKRCVVPGISWCPGCLGKRASMKKKLENSG